MSDDKRRLLLIDDDTSLLITLSDFLRFEGYDVVTAESGEKGLEKLDTMDPALIILDMSMPGMGGIGFLKAIMDEKGKPRHPVLVLTARSNMAEFFANVDIDGFVSKPCDPQDLLMEVGRIIFLRRGEKSEAGRGESHRRMILGESDPTVKGRMIDWFSKNNYTIEHCSKGPETVEAAIVSRPDVIVMNQIFEGLNGAAVADMLAVMPNTKSIPVVLYGASDVVLQGSSANADGGGVVATVDNEIPADVGSIVNAVFEK